ncbi:MAG: NUDIX hydrolase [Tetrasphaera sp.]|jgi:8-oxo-dGTP diphosphatase|nr:NUDIX hydrolase [Tetrasphaera sp.]
MPERGEGTAYDARVYPPVAVTVDLCVFTIRSGALHVLLVERGEDPFGGLWALPGGFVEPHEDAAQAAARELAEETGVDSGFHIEQLASYSTPDRDPRMRVVSIAHVAFAPDLPEPVAGSDAATARWWAVADLPLDGTETPALERLAFDHATILGDGVERVRAKLEYTTLATSFVASPFTLGELHRVYAAVWGTPPHRGTFIRKVLSTPGFVELADAPSGRASGVGRPPTAFYAAGPATHLHPALLRG